MSNKHLDQFQSQVKQDSLSVPPAWSAGGNCFTVESMETNQSSEVVDVTDQQSRSVVGGQAFIQVASKPGELLDEQLESLVRHSAIVGIRISGAQF